ncbi:hypothetical protein B0H14DRAFT_2597932 [Mycena olivaceomarginata]|nr:hypothetical protein B0H14DRAFT_2597932 [Mycena olivaceomarginata]
MDPTMKEMVMDIDDYNDGGNDEDFGSYWSSSQTVVDVEGADTSASPIDAMPLALPSTSDTSVDIMIPIPIAATLQNLHVFPQADTSISSPVTALVPRKHKVGSIADPVVPAASSSPTVAVCPLTPSSASGNMGGKENEIAEPSSDDINNLVNPVLKKSRKTRGSIHSIQYENPICAKALEAGYEYIRHKVWTEEEATWTERHEAMAILVQDALDYSFRKLGLDPSDFVPVTNKEQDLMHENIYGSRKILIAQNRAIVATLLHKQGLVFLAMAEATVFKNMLSDAIQHPEWFDDAPPPPDNDTTGHKPQFSAVFLILLICVLRGPISKWSSGHWVKESFLCKVYHSHFVSDLKMLRDWERIHLKPHSAYWTWPNPYASAIIPCAHTPRFNYRKRTDIVVPVPLNEVLDTSDFALNQ